MRNPSSRVAHPAGAQRGSGRRDRGPAETIGAKQRPDRLIARQPLRLALARREGAIRKFSGMGP